MLPIWKPYSFFTQLIIWCASNNVLKDNNACPRESWCSSPLKTRSSYLDLAFKLACFWKFPFSNYFNQGNVSASKICCCKQHFQWKYPQKSFLGNFLDATLFLTWPWTCFDGSIWKWVLFSLLLRFPLHIVLSPVFHLNVLFCA